MKVIEPQFYKLIFDGNFLDDHPEIIAYEQRNDHGFNDLLMGKGNSLINTWPQDFTLYLRGDKPIDYFLCGTRYAVLSKSAAEIIDSFAKDNVELLSTNTILNDKPIGTGSYYILNVLKSCEALNWEATMWTTHEIPYNDPSAHLVIIKPAFNSELLQDESIFTLRVNKKINSGVYISKLLKESLEERKCTVGLEFWPIKTIVSPWWERGWNKCMRSIRRGLSKKHR